MAFSIITFLDVPAEAAPGEQVNFSVRITSSSASFVTLQTMVILKRKSTGQGILTLLNDVGRFFPSYGSSHTFDLSFQMPEFDVTVEVTTFYLGTDEYYHYDNMKSEDIPIGVEAEFSLLGIPFYYRRMA